MDPKALMIKVNAVAPIAGNLYPYFLAEMQKDGTSLEDATVEHLAAIRKIAITQATELYEQTTLQLHQAAKAKISNA